jgi:hypothetical protein
MSCLSETQYAQMRAMARAYAPDLPDITCSEVLLMLYAMCEVLEFDATEMVDLFGRRAFGYLRHWGDRPVPPYPPLAPATGSAAKRQTRAWVWVEREMGPRFALLDEEQSVLSFIRPVCATDRAAECAVECGAGGGVEP